MQITVRHRPIGISIIAILGFLIGLLVVLFGAVFVIVGIVGGSDISTSLQNSLGTTFSTDAGGAVTAIFVVIGIIFGLFGLLGIGLALGLWRLKRWAWWLEIILVAIAALGSISSISAANTNGTSTSGPIVELLVAVVIFIYLLTPGVRRAFGR